MKAGPVECQPRRVTHTRQVIARTRCSWMAGDTWRFAFSAIPHHRGRQMAGGCCEWTRSPWRRLL
jgi:hypothetical protein